MILAAILLSALTGVAAAPDPASETARLGALEWMRSTNGVDLRWPDAEDYCRQLELGGHRDWRLPTMDELESLRDPNRPTGIRAPLEITTCCLWSGTTLEHRPSPDSDEIGGSIDMYRWGYMFDQGVAYYAVHIYDDGQALCVRDAP